MTQATHCRFCNGPRQFQAGICTGCGSHEANAHVTTAAKNTGIKCPRCGRRKLKKDDSTYICLAPSCGTQFEPLEVGFADTRPEMNAIRREEYKRRNAQRRCYR